jgi:hypothetical protein
LFSRWFGPLPPVVSTDGPEPWGTEGQTRTVRTADGGTLHEELVGVARPAEFTYRLSRITGAMGWLIAEVDGGWRFEAVGTGTRIEWFWTIHFTSDVAAWFGPTVGWLWRGYARQALERLEQLMVAKLT